MPLYRETIAGEKIYKNCMPTSKLIEIVLIKLNISIKRKLFREIIQNLEQKELIFIFVISIEKSNAFFLA